VQPACRTSKEIWQLPAVQGFAAGVTKVDSFERMEILHLRESFAMQEIPYKKYTREGFEESGVVA
jgi:hypothetical protein